VSRDHRPFSSASRSIERCSSCTDSPRPRPQRDRRFERRRHREKAHVAAREPRAAEQTQHPRSPRRGEAHEVLDEQIVLGANRDDHLQDGAHPIDDLGRHACVDLVDPDGPDLGGLEVDERRGATAERIQLFVAEALDDGGRVVDEEDVYRARPTAAAGAAESWLCSDRRPSSDLRTSVEGPGAVRQIEHGERHDLRQRLVQQPERARAHERDGARDGRLQQGPPVREQVVVIPTYPVSLTHPAAPSAWTRSVPATGSYLRRITPTASVTGPSVASAARALRTSSHVRLHAPTTSAGRNVGSRST
jgi:hypothetical protein